jgi:hypothetical protein
MRSLLRPGHVTRLVASLALLALVTLAAPSARAQCFAPDNLSGGPCCTPTVPVLPSFPSTLMPALGVCWQGCTVASQNTLQVIWTTLVPAATCGQFTTTLSVIDTGSGTTILTGTVNLDYTRTWDEIDNTGLTHQVWRFTAKADLSVPAGSTALICPKPNCISPIGPHPTAFYYGYMDYAGCSAAGPFDNALVLFHNCDRFIHQPGLSSRPGSFHPGSSFAIVAPHSPAQPFVPLNQIASGNPVLGEATRTLRVPGVVPTLCIFEDKIQQASMALQGAGCICTMLANPKQQTLRAFSGVTGCVNSTGQPGQWVSLNVNFPTLPWFHLVSTSIGTWTNPNAYPGPESAWADEGLFVHREACNGQWLEMKYGASTLGGWGAFTAAGPVKAFTDLADNYTAPSVGPFPMPLIGNVMPTDHLIYVNQQ